MKPALHEVKALDPGESAGRFGTALPPPQRNVLTGALPGSQHTRVSRRKDFAGTSTEYVWYGYDLVHERRTVAGEHQPLVTWLFEPGTFAPVAKLEGKKRYSVVTDHLGTPSLLMTETGKLAWKAQLDVCGVPREESAGIAKEDATYNPWRYPGQYEDTENGLYYNSFRNYDPQKASGGIGGDAGVVGHQEIDALLSDLADLIG